MEARGMGGPGGPEGTISDRVSVLHYSEKTHFEAMRGCQEQTREGTWVEALDMGRLGGPKRTIYC